MAAVLFFFHINTNLTEPDEVALNQLQQCAVTFSWVVEDQPQSTLHIAKITTFFISFIKHPPF